MKVALLHGIRDIRVAEAEMPRPDPGECLLEVKAVSICGSDLHIFSEGNVGGVAWDRPFSPCHEFAAICRGGERIPDGAMVVADPAVSCGRCDMCRRGWEHLCRNLEFAGLPSREGALRQFICWPERGVFVAPPGLDYAQAALIEPLAIAVHAVELAPPPAGGAPPAGIPVLFHCDGALAEILPLAVELGFCGVNPIEPYSNDIYAIKREYGDKLCLMGNMDVGGCLTSGTPDEVERDTREHLERLMPGGGYIAASSHSITDSVPPENFLAMTRTIHQYGRYDHNLTSSEATA